MQRILHSGAFRLVFVLPLLCGCSRFATVRNRDVLRSRHLALEGSEALARGQFIIAEQRFSEAVEVYEGDVDTRRMYAEALWQRGARADALVQMQEASRLSGGRAEVLVRLGEMYLANNDLNEAAQHADQASRANPKLATAFALKGEIARRRGRYPESLQAFHRSLFLEQSVDVQLAVAEIYFEQDKAQQCLATLQSAMSRLPPDKLPARVEFLEGLAMKSLRRYDEAIERFMVVVRKDDTHVEGWYQLADTHFLRGDRGNARLSAETVIRLNPQHPPTRQLLSKLKNRDVRTALSDDLRRDR